MAVSPGEYAIYIDTPVPYTDENFRKKFIHAMGVFGSNVHRHFNKKIGMNILIDFNPANGNTFGCLLIDGKNIDLRIDCDGLQKALQQEWPKETGCVVFVFPRPL